MGSRPLYLDCFSGAAGNMILGALLDLGVPSRVIREGLGKLGIEARMRVQRVRRGAISARYVGFRGPRRSAKERRYREIRALLDRASLPERALERSRSVFAALARAEGRVHGLPVEDVHFHEVGAVDAIGDIVGTCLALEHLDVERITASPLPLGRGRIESDHGTIPLPAPAALELLRGVPTYPADTELETVTPTGAALVATLSEGYGPLPALVLDRVGYGAGDDRATTLPNVLRAVLGEEVRTLETDVVCVLETNLDDMSPEQLPFLMERLLEDGALDATLTPLLMKKGRPGYLLSVLAPLSDRDRLARRILADSTAIGVRTRDAPRLKLPRKSRTVETRFGKIRIKVVSGPNGRVVATPEYDSARRAALRHGVPIAEVYRETERAARGDEG